MLYKRSVYSVIHLEKRQMDDFTSGSLFFSTLLRSFASRSAQVSSYFITVQLEFFSCLD